jgi:hypothetical protein
MLIEPVSNQIFQNSDTHWFANSSQPETASAVQDLSVPQIAAVPFIIPLAESIHPRNKGSSLRCIFQWHQLL